MTLGFGLAGCKDALDIAPQQGIDATTALNSQSKVGGAVVGMYAKLDDPRLYGTDLIMVPELIGADGYIQWQGTFQNYRQVALRTLNSLNTTASGIWQRAYEDINQANLVLEALPVVKDADLKNQYEGEAKFIRGDCDCMLTIRTGSPEGANGHAIDRVCYPHDHDENTEWPEAEQ